jgi:hypothetical protein
LIIAVGFEKLHNAVAAEWVVAGWVVVGGFE